MATDPRSDGFVFNYTLVKLAMRCNLKCTYCYWFRDQSVYERPAVLTQEAEDGYISGLRRHILKHGLDSFYILFHGGEPTLIGSVRFDALCGKLRALEAELGFSLRLGTTTNGVLIDAEWIRVLVRNRVSVTLSIDGPQAVHDAARKDGRGRGTFAQTIKALNSLREANWEPGVLSVCNPELDPEPLCEFFVEELGLRAFDFLVPDANHEDSPRSIAEFYIKLFDLWYDRYEPAGVKIRFLESVVTGLLGGESHSESIGYGPTSTVTMLTDGSLEPLDVLRTAGNGFTKTEFNVLTHELQDVQRDALWQEVLQATITLPEECEACAFKFACGGGHVASRFSKSRRYDNPSVYCADFKKIFRHVWNRIRVDLTVESKQGPLPMSEALEVASA